MYTFYFRKYLWKYSKNQDLGDLITKIRNIFKSYNITQYCHYMMIINHSPEDGILHINTLTVDRFQVSFLSNNRLNLSSAWFCVSGETSETLRGAGESECRQHISEWHRQETLRGRDHQNVSVSVPQTVSSARIGWVESQSVESHLFGSQLKQWPCSFLPTHSCEDKSKIGQSSFDPSGLNIDVLPQKSCSQSESIWSLKFIKVEDFRGKVARVFLFEWTSDLHPPLSEPETTWLICCRSVKVQQRQIWPVND